jgi:hypothetical protein
LDQITDALDKTRYAQAILFPGEKMLGEPARPYDAMWMGFLRLRRLRRQAKKDYQQQLMILNEGAIGFDASHLYGKPAMATREWGKSKPTIVS